MVILGSEIEGLGKRLTLSDRSIPARLFNMPLNEPSHAWKFRFKCSYRQSKAPYRLCDIYDQSKPRTAAVHQGFFFV